MNLYTKQKKAQQARINDFLHKHAFFAFDNDQFEEGLESMGLTKEDTGQLVRIQGGGFMLKEKEPEFKQMLKDFAEERQAALNDPDTGRQFAIDMFRTELNNYEYGYTGDPKEAFEALGYTMQEIKAEPSLLAAFNTAVRQIFLSDLD